MSRHVHYTIIEKARAIIADPEHWCRGSYARGKGGTPVNATDDSARRYCAMGALLLAAYELTGDLTLAHQLADGAAKIISPSGALVLVNDQVGHSAVIALFDEALVQ